MVTRQSVNAQLKKLGFNVSGWGRGEVGELPRILLPDEEIYELVNGIYEGGFALLIATDIRMLLVDKKPLNFLTVEDLRFDMINELDYSHRLIGAHINVSAGAKNLQFTSYNQQRLRKLINHVQHSMAQSKKQQNSHQTDQNQHLEQINQQLQEYLTAQHQQQEQLHKQLQVQAGQQAVQIVQPVKPSGRLADYLFAQSLLAKHRQEGGTTVQSQPAQSAEPQAPELVVSEQGDHLSPQVADLYNEGMKEVYGRRPHTAARLVVPTVSQLAKPLEINAMKIAYSKLPLALRNRKFGSPSFHDHSRSQEILDVSQTGSPAVS